MKIISEPTQNTSRDQSAKVESDGWFLQQFRVAFKDLTEADLPGGSSDNENDTCRMVMCVNGEMRVCLTGPDQKNEFFISAGSCCCSTIPAIAAACNARINPGCRSLNLFARPPSWCGW